MSWSESTLTTAIGSSLVNTLYVLDEPSIGLHPRDSRRLVEILHRLRANQNTVVVVEHDPEIIKESDYIIDLGPKAGEQGGQLMFAGPYNDLLKSEESLTAAYLSQRKMIPFPARNRKQLLQRSIKITGAQANNLKNIDVEIPLGVFVCITGVSGSGKSSLVDEVLHRNLKKLKEAPPPREYRPLRENRRGRQDLRGRLGRSVSGGNHAEGLIR